MLSTGLSNTKLRNTWLIVKREYLERVRQRSFIVLTVLLPAIVGGAFIIPAKLSSMKSSKTQHLVVVTSNLKFGEIVKLQLLSSAKTDDEKAGVDKTKEDKDDKDLDDDDKSSNNYTIDVDSTPSETERATLQNRVSSGDIDGYLWLSDDAVTARKVTYEGRESSGFMEKSWLGGQLDRAILLRELDQRGMSVDQADVLLKPVKLDMVRLKGGHETKANDKGMFFAILVMVMLLYMAVIFYGVSVMRAVLEEKNSRVMEVLLSSATSTELMAGKLIGVGAVGLTQIGIWITMAVLYALPALAASASAGDIHIPPLTLVAFALFFLLGYLLYSSRLCRCRRCHHQRAGRAATAVHHSSSADRCGVYDGAGDAGSGFSDCGMEFNGSVLLADSDVRADCDSAASSLADRGFSVAAGGDDWGNSRSLRAHLPHRHSDVWQAAHAA